MYQVASNEVIAARLQELLSPLVYNQLGYYQLGLRSPILGLPLMRAAVLTLHNLAVELFWQSFMDYAAKPEAYQSSLCELLPTYPEFTGFVFMIQANMDPKRRDRIAFVRVCSVDTPRAKAAGILGSGDKP
jgi:peptide chain release factor 3